MRRSRFVDRHASLRTSLLLASQLLPACASDAPAPDRSGENFRIEPALEVAIELDAEDWDTLRKQGRGLASTLSGCSDLLGYEYTEVPASVTIDDTQVDDVLIRKKGLLGSLSALRPSLRIELAEGDHSEREFRGITRLTLNNNLQDASNARQCVTYALFEEAGLVAPRCGFAHVPVTGDDPGSYTHVEPIKKAFLRRAFGDDSGNLYESIATSESTAERVQYFERKTNELDPDRSDLDRVVQALQADDDALEAALDEVFDLDELITFWAMEALTGHADGLTRNRNNTFLYHSPRDDRFHPIPWGTDGSFATGAVGGGEHLRSVFAASLLAHRMYAVPALRSRYQTRLRELIDQLWNEDALIERIDHLVAVSNGVDAEADKLRAFVLEQRAAIETELAMNDGEGPDVPDASVGLLGECVQPTRVNGEINHGWDEALAGANPTPIFPFPDDGIALSIPIDGEDIAFVEGTGQQSASRDAAGKLQLGMYGIDATSGRPIYVGIITSMAGYAVGTFDFHGFETFGVVLALDTQAVLGVFGDGTITLDEISTEMGGSVRGSWQGKIAPLVSAP